MTAKTSPELAAVRAKAESLGLTYHHRANVATIQRSIDEFIEQNSVKRGAPSLDVAPPLTPEEREKIVPMTSEEFRKASLGERKQRARRLTRCKITCMDPAKKEWLGEIISVGSAKWGTAKKFIPFDGREYHVPNIILDFLEERKYSQFYSTKDARGNVIRKSRLAPAFNIMILEPLTNEQRLKLAEQQRAANLAEAGV